MIPTVTIELRYLNKDRYTSCFLGAENQVIMECEFSLKQDDAYLLQGITYLEDDAKREEKDINKGFIQRMGNHFYNIITQGSNEFRTFMQTEQGLSNGFCLSLELDSTKTRQNEKEAEASEKTAKAQEFIQGINLLWQIPWEYLHDGEEFLGLSGKAYLSRKIREVENIPACAGPRPLRILVIIPSPIGTFDLNSEKEISIIQEAMDDLRQKGAVEIDYLETATMSNLRSKIKHFKPHILHYSGHGGKLEDTNETYLAFEDEKSNLKPFFGRDLKRITADSESIILVVLSGCMTAQTHHRDTFKGIGISLMENQIPAVIAMQYSIRDESALKFGEKFYEELSKGSSVVEAMNEVRFLLFDLRGENRADWGIPVLFLHTSDMNLIDASLPPKERITHVSEIVVVNLPVVRGFVGRKQEIKLILQSINDLQKTVVYISGLGGIGKTALVAKIVEKAHLNKLIEGVCVIRCDNMDTPFITVVERISEFLCSQSSQEYKQAGEVLKDNRIPLEKRMNLLNGKIKDCKFLFIFDNFDSLLIKERHYGKLENRMLDSLFSSIFGKDWCSTLIFTSRLEWNLLTAKIGKGALSRTILSPSRILKMQIGGLKDYQIIQYMNNLNGPLSRLEYREKRELLHLAKGYPKIVEFLDSYLRDHTLHEILGDEDIETKIIDDIGTYFMNSLWDELKEAEKSALILLAIFRSPIKKQDFRNMLSEEETIEILHDYSLLQREEKGYSVHQIVRQYVLGKVDKEEYKILNEKAAEFYISQFEYKLTKKPVGVEASPVDIICALIDNSVRTGNCKKLKVALPSLLELHYHLFEAEEFELAYSVVRAIHRYLEMQGLFEMSRYLLEKSIDSLKSGTKYDALYNLAGILNSQGEWKKALRIYQHCYEFFLRTGDKATIAGPLSQQALIYQQRGKYKKALEIEREVMRLIESTEFIEGILTTKYRNAQLLYMTGKLDEALKMGKEGLKLAYEKKHKTALAHFYYHIGSIWKKKGHFQVAFEYFKRSLEYYLKTEEKKGQANAAIEIGKLMAMSGNYKEAMRGFLLALEIYKEIGHPLLEAHALEMIGQVYEDQGLLEEALHNIKNALLLREKYDAPQDEIDRLREAIERLEMNQS